MKPKQNQSTAPKKYFYGRLVFYVFLIVIFIFATQRLKQSATNTSQDSEYYYSSVISHPDGQSGFDVLYYDISLDIRINSAMDSGTVYGETKVHFRSKYENLEEIVLNFSSYMQVDSVGKASSYRHKDNLLSLQLESGVSQNDTGSAVIYYHGWPKPYHQIVFGWKLIPSQFQLNGAAPLLNTANPPFGAQTWLPCKDNPADKADSVKLRITIPDSLTTISNGRLIKTIHHDRGRKTMIWKEHFPISTYLIAVNVGAYHLVEQSYHSRSGIDFPLQIYNLEADTALAEIVLLQLENMLDFFTSILGPYPFGEEKYAMVVFSSPGGMENQTVSSVGAIDPERVELYAHELVHQWIGNSATPATFHESWISEGLATYLTGLYIREFRGQSAFRHYMNLNIFKRKGKIWVEQITHPDSVYHPGRAYRKANWFFYMLHQKIGDDSFFKGLKELLIKFAYNNLNTPAIRSVFEESSGQNLSRFFKQWIYEESIPRLEWFIWQTQNSTGTYKYFMEVKQQQKSDHPYVLSIDVQFISSLNDTTLTYEIFEREHEFKALLPFLADKVFIDPANQVLLLNKLSYRNEK